MNRNKEYAKRCERVMKWYAPGRLGLFYHWGFFTGGGMTIPGANFVPLQYESAAAFEAAAPEPETVAANMVATARKFGAKYINFTCFHGGSGYAVMFPTRQPEFKLHTTRDYLGALLDECFRYGIKPLLYIPMACEPRNIKGGPYMDGIDTQEKARELYGRLVEEIAERYEHAKIGGFWLDCGLTPPFLDFPAHIRNYFKDAVILVNSAHFVPLPEVDFCVTEFLSSEPDVAYNRPAGLIGEAPPPDDFNEDIPDCGSWWYWENRGRFAAAIRKSEKPYLDDPFFLLKQLVSTLGQCGQWNFTFGIPVRLDGTLDACYQPMFENVERFLAWGSEAIYGTTGGKFSPVRPGVFHGGGFCSVTVPLDRDDVCYILVTEAPAPDKTGVYNEPPGASPYAAFFTRGAEPVCISDLRTGKVLDFDMPGGMGFRLQNVDWSDVATYGVKVLKVEFEYAEAPAAL